MKLKTALALVIFMIYSLFFHRTFVLSFEHDPFWLNLEDRFRVETWNTFDKSIPRDFEDNYTFYANRFRLGAGYKQSLFEVFGQYQVSSLSSLPDLPGFGTGVLYQTFNSGTETHMTKGTINQLYVKSKIPSLEELSLKVGRFDYNDGLETIPTDPSLKWLKEFRISQRMIGTFDWSHTGRSFDGFQSAYDQPWYNATVTAVRPTQGGFQMDQDQTIHDIDLLAGVFTLKNSDKFKNSDARLFYYFYNDTRDADCVGNRTFSSLKCVGPVRTDNTVGRAKFEANKGNLEVHSIGANVLHTIPTGDYGIVDLLAWGVYQTGDWGKLDHEAFGTAVEAGYKFKTIPWQPWFRTGYYYGSGDEDPVDSSHETFFQVLPTPRVYALTPLYNLMNNQDYFFMVLLNPLDKVKFRGDLHKVWIADDQDRWYAGAGAQHESNEFGYAGTPSFKRNELLTIADASISFAATSFLDLNAYYSRAWGNDIIEANFDDDNSHFFYLELVLHF